MNIPFFHRNLDEVSLHLNYTEDASDSTSWVKDVHFSICKNPPECVNCNANRIIALI